MFHARDGARVAYDDTGPPPSGPRDAPTIVFGHALLFGGWAFRDQVEALRGTYRCVTIDWRGQGRSHRVRHGFDLETLTNDVVDLIELLQTGPVHYVGLAMGGVIGIRLARLHPELLRSLTLVNTNPGSESPERVKAYTRLANALVLVGPRRLRTRILPIMFGATFLASPRREEILQEWLAHLQPGRKRSLRKAVIASIRRRSVEADVAWIMTPTLIVGGSDDVAVPLSKARELGATLPGSKVRVIPGAAHSLALEQPEALTSLIAEHVAAH